MTPRDPWAKKAEHLTREHGLVVEGDESIEELEEAHGYLHPEEGVTDAA